MSNRTPKSLLGVADISVVVQGVGILVRDALSGLAEGAEVVTCMYALTTQAAWGTGATFACK
jgi:hypothetical protein